MHGVNCVQDGVLLYSTTAVFPAAVLCDLDMVAGVCLRRVPLVFARIPSSLVRLAQPLCKLIRVLWAEGIDTD